MSEKGNIERLYRIERNEQGEEVKRTLANPITHAQAVIMDDGRTLSESMSTGKVEVDIRLSENGELEYFNGESWVVAGKDTKIYNADFVVTKDQDTFTVEDGVGEKSNLISVYVNGLKQADGFAKFVDPKTLQTSVKLQEGDYLSIQYFQVAGGKLDGIPNATKDNDGLMPKEVFRKLGDLDKLETGDNVSLVESINTINKKAESMTESMIFSEDFTKDKIEGDTLTLSQPVTLSSSTTDIFINGIKQPFNVIEPLPEGKFKIIPELKDEDILTIKYIVPKDIVDVDTMVTGDLGALKTTNKSNLVNAVNEVKENKWGKDELEIGGRNLFLDSAFFEISQGETAIVNGVKCSKVKSDTSTNYTKGKISVSESIIRDDYYVYSVAVLYEGLRPDRVALYLPGFGDYKEAIGLSTLEEGVWGRVFVVLKSRGGIPNRPHFHIRGGDGFVYFSKWKLEKGTIPTDWTPAPEDIQEDIKNLKQSVSDGKQKVAVAITDKGIKTAADATFDTMARNISDITTDPSKGTTDAVAADILSGKKVVSQGELITGTMPNNGTLSKTLTTQGGTQKISPGYYAGGEVKAQFANLTASNIKKGVTVGGVTGSYAGSTFARRYEGTITVPSRESVSFSTIVVPKGAFITFVGEDRQLGAIIDTTHWSSGGYKFSAGYPYTVDARFSHDGDNVRISGSVENESSSWEYKMYFYSFY